MTNHNQHRCWLCDECLSRFEIIDKKTGGFEMKELCTVVPYADVVADHVSCSHFAPLRPSVHLKDFQKWCQKSIARGVKFTDTMDAYNQCLNAEGGLEPSQFDLG